MPFDQLPLRPTATSPFALHRRRHVFHVKLVCLLPMLPMFVVVGFHKPSWFPCLLKGCGSHFVWFKFQVHHIRISFLIAIQFENRIFCQLMYAFILRLICIFDVVSVNTPNVLNIQMWCRRRTYLCGNTWPISGANYQVWNWIGGQNQLLKLEY